MTADDIFEKYTQAIGSVTDARLTVDGRWVEWPAVRLALRLAIGDAYAAGAALADDLAAIVASQAAAVGHVSNVTDRQAEVDRAQIERLNEWLAEEEPALYRDPNTDTADAIFAAIRRRDYDLTNTYHDLQAAISESDALRQQLAQLDADNARLINSVMAGDKVQETLRQAIADRDVDSAELVRQLRQARNEADDRWFSGDHLAERTNGAAAVGHVSNVTEPPVDWWQHLDTETNDYRISLDAGRRTFRQVPKAQRLLLAQAVARFVGAGRLPTQAEFDASKPDWMPGGGGIVQAFGCTWSELLTVTTFEVAP